MSDVERTIVTSALPSTDKSDNGKASPTPSGWRYYGGWFFFIMSFVMPLIGMAIPTLGLDKATTTILVGAFVVGGPEIAAVLAVALWGKETFQHFLSKGKGLLRTLLPPEYVSPTRYRIGLAIFILSGLPCWLLAYFPHWIEDAVRVRTLAAADFAFLFSFYLLGGNFWGKIRALFVQSQEETR